MALLPPGTGTGSADVPAHMHAGSRKASEGGTAGGQIGGSVTGFVTEAGGINNGTPGTPVAATTTVPFISNTLRGKHEPIKDIAARGSRVQDFTSVLGKQWGEGEITVNVDTLNVGYFLKLATGNLLYLIDSSKRIL